MTSYDLHVDRGTTFRASLLWGTRETSESDTEPFDLTGATAELLVWGKDSWPGVRTWDWQKSYPVTIDEDNTLWIELTSEETSDLLSRVEYAVKVTLPNGDVRHVLEGALITNHDRGGFR